MAQDPDIFNTSIAEGANEVCVRTTSGTTLTRGEVHSVADSVARSLLAKGLVLGDMVIIAAADPLKVILSQFACVLAGLPYLTGYVMRNKIESGFAQYVNNLVEIKYMITDAVFDDLLAGPKVSEITEFASRSSIMSYTLTSGTTQGYQKLTKRYRGQIEQKCRSHISLMPPGKCLRFSAGNPVVKHVSTWPTVMMIDATSSVLLGHKSRETSWSAVFDIVDEFGVDVLDIAKELPTSSVNYAMYTDRSQFWARSDQKYIDLRDTLREWSPDHMVSIVPVAATPAMLDIYYDIESNTPNVRMMPSYSGNDTLVLLRCSDTDTAFNRIYRVFHVSALDDIGYIEEGTQELLLHKSQRFEYVDPSLNVYFNGEYVRTKDTFTIHDDGYVSFRSRV
jgi:hypothetical protein